MAQITANFNDRDSANLSLMRLRRSGIDFFLMGLTSTSNQNKDALTNGISYPLCFGLSNSISSAGLNANIATDRTEMKLSVKSSQIEKTWDILRETGATDIHSKN